MDDFDANEQMMGQEEESVGGSDFEEEEITEEEEKNFGIPMHLPLDALISMDYIRPNAARVVPPRRPQYDKKTGKRKKMDWDLPHNPDHPKCFTDKPKNPRCKELIFCDYAEAAGYKDVAFDFDQLPAHEQALFKELENIEMDRFHQECVLFKRIKTNTKVKMQEPISIKTRYMKWMEKSFPTQRKQMGSVKFVRWCNKAWDDKNGQYHARAQHEAEYEQEMKIYLQKNPVKQKKKRGFGSVSQTPMSQPLLIPQEEELTTESQMENFNTQAFVGGLDDEMTQA